MIWAAKYVGIPHEDHGRTWGGADCWGLLRLVYADELGIDLPSYTDAYACTQEAAQIAAAIDAGRRETCWREAPEIKPFDVLLFRVGGRVKHVGIAVDQSSFLHSYETQACIARLSDPRWRRRWCATYRHEAMT